jgi:hypothetical protein
VIAWLAPGALVRLGLLAGPILVHLLLRHRARRVPFPSLRFVRTGRTAAARFRMPSDALLLVLRLAMTGLAVVALAQPVLVTAGRVAAWDARVARAVVVDVSESMQPLTAAAAAAAGAEEQSATFAFRIDSHGPSADLRRAVTLVNAAAPARREIVVISDFQSGTVLPGEIERVPAEIGLRFVQLQAAQPERLVQGAALLRIGGTARQDFVLSQDATYLHRFVNGPPAEGVTLFASPRDSAAVASLRRAVIAAGTPAPSSGEPVAIAFTGAVLPTGVQRLKSGWMVDAALRLKADRAVAHASGESSASALAQDDGIWHALFEDREGRTVVRAAAVESTFLIEVAAPPSAFLAAAVVRGVLSATAETPSRPEDEIRMMSKAELSKWDRPAARVTLDVRTPGLESDARGCWVLVLALLLIEARVRRTRHAERNEAQPNAA